MVMIAREVDLPVDVRPGERPGVDRRVITGGDVHLPLVLRALSTDALDPECEWLRVLVLLWESGRPETHVAPAERPAQPLEVVGAVDQIAPNVHDDSVVPERSDQRHDSGARSDFTVRRQRDDPRATESGG